MIIIIKIIVFVNQLSKNHFFIQTWGASSILSAYHCNIKTLSSNLLGYI